MKPAVLKELQRRTGRRAKLSVFGDRWVLTSRTGRREVFDDVEALAGALLGRGLVDRGAPAGSPAGATLEQLLEAGSGAGRPRPDPGELVTALLAGAGPRKNVP
jgi:hypothetical protein